MQRIKNDENYSEYNIGWGLTESGHRHMVSLLLPSKLCRQLQEEKIQAEMEQEIAEAVERNQEIQIRKWTMPEKKTIEVDDDEVQDPKVEATKSFAQRSVLEDYDHRSFHPVYDPVAPIHFLERLHQASNDELRNRDLKVYKELRRQGPLRKFCNPALREDFESSFRSLGQSHPHFQEVIDSVFVTLSGLGGQVKRLSPMLLIGPMGCGKSCFALDLAKTLGASCLALQMDAAVTRMSLVGSDRRYSNTSAGELFNLICLGEHANPVVLLDELDKVNQDSRDNALAPLHGIMEPVTAKKFCDISTLISFDVSMVTWIATANHAEMIPSTLRSRFREFMIKPPRGLEAILVSHAVVKKVLANSAPTDFLAVEKSIAVKLAHLNAREIYQSTEHALAHALSNGRNFLQIGDFHADANLLELDVASGNPKSVNGQWLH